MNEWKTILSALTEARIKCGTEAKMHGSIIEALTDVVPFQHEATIPGFGRIDFIAGDETKVGVEAKVKGDLHSVGSQMQRYIRAPIIEGLILVTSCPQHRKLAMLAYGARVPVHVLFVGFSNL